MLNFRNTTIVFFMALLAMNLMFAWGIGIPLWCWIVLVVLYLAVSVAFSFFICSGFHMRVACHGDRSAKRVALTFDDGPDPVNTPLILDILKSEKIAATFFLVGRKLEGNEDLVSWIVAEGHEVGGHSYSHSDWFDFFSPRKMVNEFIRTDEKILEISGRTVTLFRPPYGVINPMVKKALSKRKYIVTGYSNRLWDTAAKDPEKMVKRFRKQLRAGDIILLHDTMPVTVNALPEMIRFIKESGYSAVTVPGILE